MTITVTASFWGKAPEPFTARYDGACALPACERHGEIEQGDAVQYQDDELMHLACARRVRRDQAEPLCGECFCYHSGGCA